jgi:hypothetical protein
MLISLLLRVVATIFTARPSGIEPGQWSPHAREAVRLLESRHFRRGATTAAPVRRVPQRHKWQPVPPSWADEGEWTCRP